MRTTPLPAIHPADALRFDGLVDREHRGPDDCWPYVGGLVDGYGSFRLGRRKVRAHRVAWKMWSGQPEPDGPLDHTCHDPTACTGRCPHRRCCNPRHLRPSSYLENNAPARRRTRAASDRCVNGHLYTDASTRWYTARDGTRYRICRDCVNAAARRRVRTHDERAAEYRRRRARRTASG